SRDIQSSRAPVQVQSLDPKLRRPDRLLGQTAQPYALLVQRERLVELDLPRFEGTRDRLQTVQRLFEGDAFRRRHDDPEGAGSSTPLSTRQGTVPSPRRRLNARPGRNSLLSRRICPSVERGTA